MHGLVWDLPPSIKWKEKAWKDKKGRLEFLLKAAGLLVAVLGLLCLPSGYCRTLRDTARREKLIGNVPNAELGL